MGWFLGFGRLNPVHYSRPPTPIPSTPHGLFLSLFFILCWFFRLGYLSVAGPLFLWHAVFSMVGLAN
ncbi:hypothetical protein J3F84DRAFT_382632 [Trichoderma pleuroticola]